MSKTKHRTRLFASTILAGVVTALAPVAVMAPASHAVAQDYTNGALTGRILTEQGAPVANASVSIRSVAQGVVRETTAGADGLFRTGLIPAGDYQVTVSAPGYVSTQSTVVVSTGSQSAYEFVIASSADVAEVGEVVVTAARRRQDFAATTAGANLDVEQLQAQLPIARNITAVTLLAPGTIPGDSAFATSSAQLQQLPSLAGASVAENAYFVNGLNITNFINGLGGAPVPFDFYKSVDVKTGGFPAEFGRATGGVISAVTKSGTNEFEFGLHGTWAPDELRQDSPNSIWYQNSLYEFDETTLTAEAGGPILRDRLFAYGLVSWQDTELASATTSGVYNRDSFSNDPFYGLKIDGYITNDHHLELTYFETARERQREVYSFDTDTNEIDWNLRSSSVLKQGGTNWVARYTGNLTDWLSVSAAYGETTVDQSQVGNLVDESIVVDYRTNSQGDILSRQSSSSTVDPFLAERKFYRADADMYFSLMGDHHVRVGYDHEETLLTEVSAYNGGRAYFYYVAGATNSLGLAEGQQFIQARRFVSGGGFGGENEALYIQDSWDVSDRLNLQLGWRQDKFLVADPNDTPFINFDDEQGLRLGFSFDPEGDARSKLYGSYGRYYLPGASNTAYRMASTAIDIREYFIPTGGGAIGPVDPVTGLPTAGLGQQLTRGTGAVSLQACPEGVGSLAPAGTLACSVLDDGTSTPPEYLAAKNLESTYEDEWRVGYTRQVGENWTFGVAGVYRNMGRAVEDALLDQGVLAYCEQEGIAGCNTVFNGTSYYLLINPGHDVVATLPKLLPGDTERRTITMKAEDLGIPEAKREYIAAEFTFERAFDGVWGLQGSYVLSKSEGNYEGAVKSDNGQTDAGIVSTFDFQSFIPGQYGLLPNHRGHQFKVFGSWQATPDLLVGANVSVISPRHYGCIGNAPVDYLDGAAANDAYGPEARFCNGRVVDRGTSFQTDWIKRVDLSFRYTVPLEIPGDLVLRADVFNIFNSKGVTEANEYGELVGGAPDTDYKAPISYQAPRTMRVGFDWQF